MTYVLAYYPVLTWAFFFGLILCSSALMFRDIKGWKGTDAIFLVLGLGLGVALCLLSPTQTTDDLWFIFICGALAICTMILPGVSGSFVLLILGKYDYIMNAVSTLNVPVLLAMGAGCIVGILAFAKLLHFLLARWEKQTMIVLLGFVLGSLIKVWPWYDMQAVSSAQVLRTGSAAVLDYQILPAVLCCLAGAALVLLIDRLGKGSAKKA